MTENFDDADFWDRPDAEPTIQMPRIRRSGPIERTRTHKAVPGKPARTAPGAAAGRRAGRATGATPAAGMTISTREPGGVDHGHVGHRPDEPSEEFELMWADHGTAGGAAVGWLRGIDPRLLSVGSICVAVVLAVPLFSALGSGDSNDGLRSIAADSTTTVEETTTTEATTTTAYQVTTTAPAPTTSPPSSTQASSGDSSTSNDDSASTSNGGSSGASSASSGGGAAGILSDPAQRPAAQCGNPYEVQAGDYWVGLANAVDMSLDDFLDYNESTADTALYPGSTVCLPLGESIAPPTTEAPATTAAATTEPPTTAATTQAPSTAAATQAPSTAAATQAPSTAATTQPSTTRPSTSPPPARGDVEALIRSIWPEHLHDMALRVAWRESNYRAGAVSPSGCCLGVFQVHWEAHRSWLPQVGIASRDQLFDAELNIRAAYMLYQRSGGWGPWSATAH